jgi:RNA polymerase sigma-70 factor (ECF subfamily)
VVQPDPDTWTSLGGPLRRFIGRRVRDRHAAEDITQDVMLKVQAHLRERPPPEKLVGWIYQAARNAVADYYRSPRSRPPTDADGVEEPSADAAAEREDAAAELAACLRPMIERLPPAYRQALELTEFDGLTQQELADRVGISLSGAKSRVQRAREQMKTMLLDCCRVELDRRGGVVDHQRTERSDGYCNGRGGC